ncbi:hypothetical protein HOLleu_13925 [Holothuria leucospilota]|uniref:Ig-like domain-containing protein n=1 Tax=Holothuria leucospilota TaxID=206669 RepID=A0A9Q1HBB8_HOLLE|nr:hypothetical protein HOLleu_13925 [Holothuria leucospilota]
MSCYTVTFPFTVEVEATTFPYYVLSAGEPLSLTATTADLPPEPTAIFRWRLNGKAFPKKDFSGLSFSKEGVSPDDQGVYECFRSGQYVIKRHSAMNVIVRTVLLINEGTLLTTNFVCSPFKSKLGYEDQRYGLNGLPVLMYIVSKADGEYLTVEKIALYVEMGVFALMQRARVCVLLVLVALNVIPVRKFLSRYLSLFSLFSSFFFPF